MDIAIVGAGRVGTALGVLLARAGHKVVAVSGRDGSRERAAEFLPDVPLVSPREAAAAGELVVLGVPDDRIGSLCEELARAEVFAEGQAVVHLSGSVPLRALDSAGASGARTLSLHPLQTFPDVEAALKRLPGSAVAVTATDEDGCVLGERLAREAGARPFRIPDDRKPLYHAAAVFCSNYLAVVQGLAERLFRQAGLEDPVSLFAPLAEATLSNVLRLGPADALTGPALRGDAGTLRRHLEALVAEAPEAVPAYVALAAAALDLAEESERLDEEGRLRVEEVLAPWR